ncbi:MAG: prephenate dehydrogenase/arogenate dehydrogenase family protein [Eubacteriales bacterium]
MRIGIIGLGLIGGSFAKAFKKYTTHTIYAWDQSNTIRNNAELVDAVDGFLPDGNPASCELILIALYPQATIDYVKSFQREFDASTLVVDCAGVKQEICNTIAEIATKNSFHFCGGHPMAGLEHSGFTYSKADLFQGSSMILTPYEYTDISILNNLSQLLKSIGFARMQVSTPKEHDEMIAYTSQLAHVVSSAYVRSPLSDKFLGFSAGSFRDMTRVAKLNEAMWSELFLANSEYLADEIDALASRLTEYSQVIRKHDQDTLKEFLIEGTTIRKNMDNYTATSYKSN